MSAAEQGEPTGALERVEYYRAILDETPEYWILTREARQIWTIAEAVQELHLSAHGLRSAFADGLLPGARPGAGRRGMEIPRSALIVHLGRLVRGWYERQDKGDRGDKSPAHAG
jgi:hypothetical protein